MVTTNNLTMVEIKSDQELIEKQHGVLPLLKTLLADECMLYISMIGVNHAPLSVTVEDHLNEIDDAMDKIAGYMRQYNTKVSQTMDEFLQKAHLHEVPHVSPDTRIIIANLITNHRAIIRLLHGNILATDEESEDVDAVDLMISLLQQHQKMMKSLQMYLES